MSRTRTRTRAATAAAATAAAPNAAKSAAAQPPADPLSEVFNWIINGATEHQIIEAIEKLWPGRKPRPLIVAARNRITQAAEVDRTALIGWSIEATRTIYQRAMEAGDHAAALRAVKQLHALADEAEYDAADDHAEDTAQAQEQGDGT